MKNVFLIKVLLLFCLTTACKERKALRILFCESLDGQNNCVGQSTKFRKDQRVYVRFESDRPFDMSGVTGILYVVDEKGKTFLGDHRFDLKPGDSYVTYFLPFERFKRPGEYQVEFMNTKGYVMDSARVIIK